MRVSHLPAVRGDGDGVVRGWKQDAVAAVVSAALLVAVSAHIPSGSGHRALDGPGYTLLVLAGLAMGACRRWPRLATAAVTIVLCVFIARDYPDGPVWLTGWAALAVLAGRTDRRTAVTGALVMIAALTVTAATTAAGGSGVLLWAVYLGWSAAAVLLGEAISSRRSYLAGLAERACLRLRRAGAPAPIRWACGSGWASRTPCSATPRCSSWMSRPTGWTRPESPGCAGCCAISPTAAARCCCPRTCCARSRRWPTNWSSSAAAASWPAAAGSS